MRLVVLGQSFVMHQIRKMVGAAVAVCRGAAPPGFITAALAAPAPVPTPLAPELGLFLDECIFDSYNARWGADGRANIARAGALGVAAEAFKARARRPSEQLCCDVCGATGQRPCLLHFTSDRESVPDRQRSSGVFVGPAPT